MRPARSASGRGRCGASSWQRIGSRLYPASGAPKDHWAPIRTHQRMLPASAVFAGLTAAGMHGLDVEPASPVEIALPGGDHLRSRAGLPVRPCSVNGEGVTIRELAPTKPS